MSYILIKKYLCAQYIHSNEYNEMLTIPFLAGELQEARKETMQWDLWERMLLHITSFKERTRSVMKAP